MESVLVILEFDLILDHPATFFFELLVFAISFEFHNKPLLVLIFLAVLKSPAQSTVSSQFLK